MKVFFDLKDYSESFPNPVVTLGNFDGVHIGHQKIFETLAKEALSCQGTTVVVTFFPHPLKVLYPERSPLLLTTLDERIQLIRSCGNDVLVCVPFTEEFADWSAERFVREILVERLRAKKVLVGEDFRFGKDRRGDVTFLKKCGGEQGFSVRRVGPVKVHGREASSTRIRYFIQKGLIRESTSMLGRPHSLQGTVVEGEKRGKSLGFPTANLHTEAELLPPNGVYAVWVTLENAYRMPAVANLGTNPTFAGAHFSLEVHIFDFAEDIYGKPMKVELVEWIRQEQTFPNANALVDQIQEDVRRAWQILENPPPGSVDR